MRPNGLLANFFLHFKGTTSGDECFFEGPKILQSTFERALMVFTIFAFFKMKLLIMKILPVTLFRELVPTF